MNISFSTRFENITDITNAFIARGKDAPEARDEAKFIEGEILKTSKTPDEYQKLCAELLVVTKIPEPSTQTSTALDDTLNPDGPSFGDYSCATFHKDGQMSTIFKARYDKGGGHGSIVALKVTTPSQLQPPHNAQREARILAEAKHDHVVPLHQSFWSRDQFILVFPFLRQDLENLIRSDSLTQAQCRIVFHGLFGALAHVHSLSIIHRDVKPSNILLGTMEGPVFLADFGIAWSATDPQSEAPNAKITDVGTTSYRPPELLFGNKSYDASLDMWAAGCVISEMVRTSHYPLFDAGPLGSELGLIKSIFTTIGTPTEKTWPSVTQLPDWGKVRFQEFPARNWHDILAGAPDEAVDFVQRTVCYESRDRLTALEALNHPLARTLSHQ